MHLNRLVVSWSLLALVAVGAAGCSSKGNDDYTPAPYDATKGGPKPNGSPMSASRGAGGGAAPKAPEAPKSAKPATSSSEL